MGMVREQACALTKKRITLWGRSAPQVCDHRLLEDSSERGGALDSDVVVPETARDGWGQCESRRMSTGADKKAIGAAPHSSEVTALPLSPSHSLVMPSVV